MPTQENAKKNKNILEENIPSGVLFYDSQ